MIRAGVIGYGYWGPNVVRNFRNSGKFELAVVCDQSPAQLELVKKTYPDVAVSSDVAAVLADPSIEALAIVTPVASHFQLTQAAMRAGKHVWVEKPITASSEEAKRLCDEADKLGKILFVDHTFTYTGAVRKLREVMAGADIGPVWTFDSVRANLGLFRPDANVMWDLAVHDVSIMDYALSPSYKAISATGSALVPGMPPHTAHMIMYLGGGAVAHVHVDWMSPVKVRRTTVVGARKMVVYDDNEAVEKIRVFDRGVDIVPVPGAAPKLTYRQGEPVAPELAKLEALTVAATHFAESIEQKRKPITDGEFGLRVVRVIEAADKSLAARGAPIEL
jgi:predicted dehydrogenase